MNDFIMGVIWFDTVLLFALLGTILLSERRTKHHDDSPRPK